MKRLILSLTAIACAQPAAIEDSQDTAPSDNGSQDTGEAPEGQVVIAELVAKNGALDTDENGDHDDWLVLQNVGTAALSLDGWRLTDDYELEVPWDLPAGQTLGPGDTLLIWCDDESDQGELHANFKLSSDGETLHLLDADDAVVQSLTFPALEEDQKYVRADDGSYSVP